MENKYDVTIMYSGGLDSLIAYSYAKHQLGIKPLCLFVDMDHEYAHKELNAMHNIVSQAYTNNEDWLRFVPNVRELRINGLIPLIQSRLSNQIIPSRNVMLATIGSMFAPRVWINALDGEQNGKEHDKSVRFFDDTSELLTFTNSFFQDKTIIESPFAKMTKAETITWALDNGMPLDLLFQTSSCYHGEKEKCGECLTCYKRYTAFLLNGIVEEGYETNPLSTDYAEEMRREIPKAAETNDTTRFTSKRIAEHFKLYDMIISGKLEVSYEIEKKNN
jgi:7-cyano-7-deazaguanine synthase in queuosine biosynthesis